MGGKRIEGKGGNGRGEEKGKEWRRDGPPEGRAPKFLG
jgi:hypothetical protein